MMGQQEEAALRRLQESGQVRDLRQEKRRAPAPGERAPLTATIVGQAGGPWGVIGDGGVTIALGMGDETKLALLGLLNLAALAVQKLDTADVREALDRAAAIIDAQAQAAAAQRQQLTAAACQAHHPGEKCQPGKNHPAQGGPTLVQG